MAHSGTHFGFRLIGTPHDVALFRDWLRGAGVHEGAWERQTSTYFDTPLFDLKEHHISLCIQQRPHRTLRSIEVGSARANASSFLHKEFSCLDYPAAVKALCAPIGDRSVDDLLLAHQDVLQPQYGLVVDRWASLISGKAAKIEIATVEGYTERYNNSLAGDAIVEKASFSEIEFSSIAGALQPMIAIAKRAIIASRGRLRFVPSVNQPAITRFEPWPKIAKASKVNLDTEGTAYDCLKACFFASAERIATLAPYVIDVRSVEGARQMRIALRRFRSVERVFRKATGSKKLRRLAEKAKWFGRTLGEARDWDVFISETLPRFYDGPENIGVRDLQARAEALRSSAWERAAREIGSQEFSLLVLEIYRFASAHNWHKTGRILLFEPLNVFAGRALDQRLKKAVRVGQDLDPTAPEAGHPIRIEIKKLRYAAQTFRDLYPKAMRKPYFRAMSDLQDGFGALNDAVVAQQLAEIAAKGQGPSAMRAAAMISHFRGDEAAIAMAQISSGWHKFVASKPFWQQEDEAPKSLIERLIERSENDLC